MAMLGDGRCGGRPQHVVTVPLRVRVRWGVDGWCIDAHVIEHQD